MDEEKGRSVTPLWEVVTGVAGLIIVCSIVIYLVVIAIKSDGVPPDFDIEIVDRVAGLTNDDYMVYVRIENTGGNTAAQLEVEARLLNPDGSEETASVVIDYLSPDSVRYAGFYFRSDPDAGILSFVPLSYQDP